MSDASYALTRHSGARSTVVRVLGALANPETGERELLTELYNIRLVFKEPTAYARLFRANATQQDIGTTTFIFWLPDLTFTKLTVEDYIITEGLKHQVVTSTVEGSALVVTAREVVGAVPKQVLELIAANDLVFTSVGVVV